MENLKIINSNKLILNRFERLTCREEEVLQLISHGYSTKEICGILFLSIPTIETYRSRLLAKLKCKNMAQLVRKGFEIGLLAAS